jgi:peptidoglycan hydrolase-like protein with peptidoglycan-binding domain
MNCGDSTIDGLLAGDASVKPLTSGAVAPAVGHLQDLLRGHGYSYLPDPRAASYGTFGSATGRAIADYRSRNGLSAADQADSGLLRDIISRPAPKAGLGPAYVPLVLDAAFAPILRFVWLTSLFETGGVFQTLNLNTDQCGVSFGISAVVAEARPAASIPAGLQRSRTRRMGAHHGRKQYPRLHRQTERRSRCQRNCRRSGFQVDQRSMEK